MILCGTNFKNTLGYYPGVWKINFEKKIDRSTGNTEVRYVPLSYAAGQGYIGSYTSIMGSSRINYNDIKNSDIYTYLESKYRDNSTLRKIYYYALGRERHGAFNINNINYELYGSNTPEKYFLKDY